MTLKSSSLLMKTRTTLGPVTKRVPQVHRALVGLYHLVILEVLPRISALLRNKPVAEEGVEQLSSFLGQQKELTLDLQLAAPGDVEQLKQALIAAGCDVAEGGWTLYIKPSESLRALVPQLWMYPASAGLKILKDMRPPEAAAYAAHYLRPTPGAAALRARTPLPRELLRVSAHLHAAGLGPQTYDLVALNVGGKQLTAFVCEHVDGRSPARDEYRQFVDRLDRVLHEEVLELVHGNHSLSSDFAAPDCNGNLITPRRQLSSIFVDFQSFRFRSEAKGLENWTTRHAATVGFGGGRIGRSREYLYQTIPGLGQAKRGTLDRWRHVDNLLREAQISLRDKVVYDIGCNSGLMSYYALSRGATWCFGWDRTATANAAKELMPLLGATRFSAAGVDINDDTDFVRAVPPAFRDDSHGVLFLFSICHHIGFPKGLFDLPWGVCVFEGSAGDTVETATRLFASPAWRTKYAVLAAHEFLDGDSPGRPILVLKRAV